MTDQAASDRAGANRQVDVSARRLAGVAWPLALNGLVSVLVSSNDVILLGRTSPVVIASAVVSSSVLTVAVSTLSGLAIGAQIEAARARGAGHDGAARTAVESALRLVAFIGIPIVAALVLLAPLLTRLLAGNAADPALAAAYLRITLIGAPFAMVAAVLRAAAAAYARTRVALVSAVVSACADVGLSLLLVGPLGWLGVAVGTVAGYVSAAVVLLVWRHRLPAELRPRLSWRLLARAAGQERAVFRLGWPESVLALFSTASGLVVVIVLADATPAMLAASKVLDVQLALSWVVLNACGQALLTLLAEARGAGRDDLVTACLRTGAVALGGTAATIFLLVAPWSSRLAGLAGGPEVSAAVGALGWLAWGQVIWQAGCVLAVSLCRALRDTRAALTASLIGEYAVFLPAGLLLCRVLGLDLLGVLIAHHLFWLTFVTVAAIRARRAWLR